MVGTLTPSSTEGAIWSRLFQKVGKKLSLNAAKAIAGLDFAPEDKERMRELAEGARDDTLTPPEVEEVRTYERAGNLLALMKSKARQRLKRSRSVNASRR